MNDKDISINYYTGEPLDSPRVKLSQAQIDEMINRLFGGEKQTAKVEPAGEPLEPWEGQVEITPEDVALAILEWNERVPKARGLLGG